MLGCDLILPGRRWIAGSTNPRLGFSKQPVRLGFPHRAGLYRHGRPPFLVPGLLLYMYGRIHDAGMRPYPPRAALCAAILRDCNPAAWQLTESQCCAA